jgi:hypothetical protein
MYWPRELRRKHGIDLLMPGNPGTPFKAATNHHDPKMSFRIRRHAMHIAFVANLEEFRRKSALKLLLYLLLHNHEKPAKKLLKEPSVQIITKVNVG